VFTSSADRSTASDDDSSTPEPAAERGADRWHDLTLTLEEAFLGCIKTVQLEDEATCAHCDGSGEEVLAHSRLCAACHGSGRLRSAQGLTGCDTCGGHGYRNRQPCTHCEGSGRHIAERSVSVKIAAGTLNGVELRVNGEGHAPTDPAGRSGDLLLRVSLAPHDLFAISGRDLILERPVSALRMLLGGAIRVPLPGGVRTIKIAPGDAQRREMRVDGAGFPGTAGTKAGALILRLVPELPSSVSPHARELIEALESTLASELASHMPELARWEARWLDEEQQKR
jgi:molecular chaperone DnaJ